MKIIIGDKAIIVEGSIIVTYTKGNKVTYNPKDIAQIYLNESQVVDIQVLKN